jgi:hypothetical protein
MLLRFSKLRRERRRSHIYTGIYNPQIFPKLFLNFERGELDISKA